MGTLNFHQLVFRPASPPHPSSGERLVPRVPTQGKTSKIPDLEWSVPMGGSIAPTWGRPAQVEEDATDVLPHVEGSCINEAMPQPGHASGGEAPTPGPPRGPGFRSPEVTALGTLVSAPESSDIVDFRSNEPGLSGYPRVSPLSATWRQVEGGVELACS
jgi:hypothetical protein